MAKGKVHNEWSGIPEGSTRLERLAVMESTCQNRDNDGLQTSIIKEVEKEDKLAWKVILRKYDHLMIGISFGQWKCEDL